MEVSYIWMQADMSAFMFLFWILDNHLPVLVIAFACPQTLFCTQSSDIINLSCFSWLLLLLSSFNLPCNVLIFAALCWAYQVVTSHMFEQNEQDTFKQERKNVLLPIVNLNVFWVWLKFLSCFLFSHYKKVTSDTLLHSSSTLFPNHLLSHQQSRAFEIWPPVLLPFHL